MEPGNSGDDRDLIDDDLDDRFVLIGDPEDALRRLLKVPARDDSAVDEPTTP